MSDLAASAVTLLAEWYEGSLGGKQVVVKHLQVDLTNQGGTSNKILASSLGFTKIIDSSQWSIDNDSAIYTIGPSYDGSFLIARGEDASTPVELSGTFRGVVKGYV